jgi:thiamine-monophosphate kinase
LLRGLTLHPAARGLNDDCAVLEIGGETLIITHDAMVEGVHFLGHQDPADIAWKLVASNMSDLAAKGAEPLGVLLGYQLGRDDARFAAGLREALEQFDVPLLGGDTIGATGAQVLGLTALGRATHRPVPSRSGASAGDTVWVTGTLGAAMAGFEALQAGAGDSLAYRRPVPLLVAGRTLAPWVTAMMDISDGLLIDSKRMAEASAVTITLNSREIPIAVAEARRDEALRWGEDYQLLFTLPAGAAPPCPATCIGSVYQAGPHPLLLDGAPPTGRLGYEHG